MHDLSATETERSTKMQEMWDKWAHENDVLPKP